MTIRPSTGLRDSMNGKARASIHAFIIANTISFDAATKQIRDSANHLLDRGFLVGDKVTVLGTSNNNTTFTLDSVAAGVATTTVAPANESAGTYFAIAAGTGGQLRDALRNGVLYEYTGVQPATADAAVGTATLLRKWTKDGGAFSHGSATNGINLAVSSSGTISKDSGEIWRATGLANGTAGWMRFCGNPTDDGSESTTLPRIDMSCGTSSTADVVMGSTSVVLNSIYYLNSLSFVFPYQYGA